MTFSRPGRQGIGAIAAYGDVLLAGSATHDRLTGYVAHRRELHGTG